MSRRAWVLNRDMASGVKPLPDVCHILFEDPGRMDSNLPKKGWLASIVIRCHDITKPIKGYTHFTEAMAKDLMSFIEGHQGRSMVVSCDAGLSRSVAVGVILRDYFEYDVKFLAAGDDSFRNVLICATLARKIRGFNEH
jgi:hypothetical protein